MGFFCDGIVRIRLGKEISAPDYDFVNHDFLKPMNEVVVRETGENLEIGHCGKTIIIGKNPFSFMVIDAKGILSIEKISTM